MALETNPGAHDRVAANFPTSHTIQGTSSFLGFKRL
jgi:chemotaxis protein histidine kinase CheA